MRPIDYPSTSEALRLRVVAISNGNHHRQLLALDQLRRIEHNLGKPIRKIAAWVPVTQERLDDMPRRNRG